VTEEQSNPPDKPSAGDAIAARAALLDFYGDYTVSFSSQFLASIFGLITACALINGVLCTLLNGSINWFLITIFFIISLVAFLGFVVVSFYTYKRFSYYSDLASKLAEPFVCLRKAALLHEIPVDIGSSNRKETRANIKNAYSEVKGNLPDNAKPIIAEKKDKKRVYTFLLFLFQYLKEFVIINRENFFLRKSSTANTLDP
jgi:hypothetical protein